MNFYKIKGYKHMKDWTLDMPTQEWFKEFNNRKSAYEYAINKVAEKGLYHADVELVN